MIDSPIPPEGTERSPAIFALDIYAKPTEDMPGYALWMGTNHPGINDALCELVGPVLEKLKPGNVAAMGRYGLLLAVSQEMFDNPEHMQTVERLSETVAARAEQIAVEQGIDFKSLGNVIEEQQGRMANVVKLTIDLADR